MKKIGIFLDEIKDKSIDEKQKFSKLGFNTGNMLFWHSLKTQLNLDVKSRWYIDHIDQLDLTEYKAFITTDLIWIRQMQDFSYLNKTLDVIGDLPLIPISIGLQCDSYDYSFKLHPDTVKVIKRIEQRCVMGVRGEYTAKILRQHGITNFMVIGCPSMYMNAPGLLTVNNNGQPRRVTMNFETFYSKLDEKRISLLEYGMENQFSFVEQAQSEISKKQIADKKRLSSISEWLKNYGKCFFDINEWRGYIKEKDFSIGSRFHGNVLALWEGVPALFITCDSRTQELCELFSLPHIDIKDFDSSMSIEHYYKLADYADFASVYSKRIEEWKEFLKVNGLKTERVLYHCFTAYQFLEFIVHKQLFHKDAYSVLLVSNDFKDRTPQIEDFIKNKFFDKVLYIDPNKGMNPATSEIEQIVRDYYNSLFEANGFNYSSFGSVYIAGAYRNFGIYASLMQIPFSIFEDASGTLTTTNQYEYDKNNDERISNLINQHGLYFGDSKYIKSVYCDLSNLKNPVNPNIEFKVHNFNVSEQFRKLDKNTQDKVLSIYNCPKSIDESIAIIFTQWFVFNNQICNDNRIILHYQYLCDIFASSEKVMIKRHPADPIDYTGCFTDCIVSVDRYPSELINCSGFNVCKVISINSTANNAFPAADSIKIEQNPFTPLEIYNKLIVIGGILQIFPELHTKCYGVSEHFITTIYHHLIGMKKNVEWNRPIQQPNKTILIIDYLNWGIGTSPDELPSIIEKMPYDSIYIFINRSSTSFDSLKLNELFDYAVPIVINYDRIKNKTIFNNYNREIIWAFSRNSDYIDKLRSFRFNRILTQVGIKLNVNPLTMEDDRNVKTEERLRTITKALIKLESYGKMSIGKK